MARGESHAITIGTKIRPIPLQRIRRDNALYPTLLSQQFL
jgi:hypothetical protein